MRLTIRTKLVIGIALLIALTCAGISLFAYQTTSNSVQAIITESLPTMAVESGKLVRNKLDNHILAMEGVANRHVIRSMDWKLQRPAMINEIKRLGYLDMAIVNTEGIATYTGENTKDLSMRQYIKDSLAGKTVVSDVIISSVTNKPVIMLATPIKGKDDTVTGALIARMDGDMLSAITRQIKFGEKGYSYIINNEGALIAHNKLEYVVNKRNFLKEGKTNPDFKYLSLMMQNMTEGKTGFDEYWFVGSQRLFGYAPIPGTNWSIAVGAVKDEVFAQAYAMRAPMAGIFAGFLIFGILIAFLFARSISNPILDGVHQLSEIAEKGNLSVTLNEKRLRKKDEIGDLYRALQNLTETQKQQAEQALSMASGNWALETTIRSHQDQFGHALNDLVIKMNETLQIVNEATMQVRSGSAQIADASQSLSQGATESAASMEEITASMAQIGSQTRLNAENAQQANQLAATAKTAAEKGCSQMSDMVLAMEDINNSSQQIARIIKVIDDIAFQTNLLALNAAVEAARAGRHGKGFAVVAEEVRNLAARSAKAAKETEELIESSVAKVKNGTEIANQTATALTGIVEGATKSADIVGEIAAASNEQAQGIAQVSQGLTQIDNVTQQNTGNAEQMAAAAEELSGQAEFLHDQISRFKLRLGSSATTQHTSAGAPSLPQPQAASASELLPMSKQAEEEQLPATLQPAGMIDPRAEIKLDDEEFGKY